MNQPKYNYEREKYLEVYALFATLQQKSTQETLSQHEIIENVRKRIQELSLDEKYFHAQYRNLKSEFSRWIISTDASWRINYQETLERNLESRKAKKKSQEKRQTIQEIDTQIRTQFLKENWYWPDRMPLKWWIPKWITIDVITEALKNDLKKVAQQAIDEWVEIHNFLWVQEYFSQTIKRENRQKLNDTEMTYFLKQYNFFKNKKQIT